MDAIEQAAIAAFCAAFLFISGLYVGYTSRGGDEVLQAYGTRMAEYTLEQQGLGQ